MRLAALGVLVVATATSCGLVAGLGDYGEAFSGAGGAGAGVASGGQGAAPMTCGDGVCLPDAPEGWLGPVLVSWRGDVAEECPSLWSDDGDEVHAKPVDSHLCTGCDCQPPTGVSCGPRELAVYENAGCPGTPSQTVGVTQNCQNIQTGLSDPYFLQALPVDVMGDCGADPEPAEVQGLPFEANGRLCAPSTTFAGTCPSGFACLPGVPVDYVACIWRDGDAPPACPDDFPEPQPAYRAFLDDRGCVPCSCAMPSTTCSGQVFVFQQSCGTSPTTLAFGGACSNAGAWVAADLDDPITPPSGLSCLASGGDPIGGVQTSEPVSLCCRGAFP